MAFFYQKKVLLAIFLLFIYFFINQAYGTNPHQQEERRVPKQGLHSKPERHKYQELKKLKQEGKLIAYSAYYDKYINQYFSKLSNWSLVEQKFRLVKLESDFIWERYDKLYSTRLLKKGQIYNFVPGWQSISDRGLLHKNLQALDQKQLYNFDSSTFYLKSYFINYSYPNITQEEKMFLEDKNQQNLWVERLTKSNKFGKLKVISNMTLYKEKIQSRKNEKINNTSINEVLLQQYQEQVHLIGDRKYNIKTYMVVGYKHPSIVFYQDGYIILQTSKFIDLKHDPLQLQMLLNQQSQAHNKLNEKSQDEQLLMEEYKELLRNTSKLNEDQINDIFTNIKKCMTYNFLILKDHIVPTEQSNFQIFEFDFIIEPNLNPLLLSIRNFPVTKNYSARLAPMFKQIIKDSFDLIIYLNQNKNQVEQLLKDDKQLPTGKMQLLYNEASGYSFISKYLKGASSKVDL